MSETTREMTIEEMVGSGRKQIEELSLFVKAMKSNSYFNPNNEADGIADVGEMIANIMLAYRHLEDARMRLGKVYQAMDGGKSVYNK